MTGYTTADLRAAMVNSGVLPGDVLCVHSALFPLGRLEGHAIRAIPGVLCEVLLDYLGNEGTLVVPAFNFGFCKGHPYDRLHTPSAMGPLSEYVRCHPHSIRSLHPMQSVAAVGRHADYITAIDTLSAFDPDGAFDRMIRLDAKLILLGASIQSASVLLWIEQKLQVPYRYWKSFTGTCIDESGAQQRTYRMYARDLQVDPHVELDLIETTMKREGTFHEAPLGAGWVKVCRFSDFVRTATALLENDPYCLVSNRTEVERHYA